MARGRGDDLGKRVQVSRNPEQFDWRITYHSKNRTKKDMGDVYPQLLLSTTREDAERAMWRTRFLDGNKGYDLRLARFQAFPDGKIGWQVVAEWKKGEEFQFSPVTGIDENWEENAE